MPMLLPLLLATAGTSLAASPNPTLEVAPLVEALTFARTSESGRLRTIVVTSHADGSVSGIDLEALLGRPITDPVGALESEGWQGLHDRLVSAPDDAAIVVPTSSLTLPVDFPGHHIAAGTNYPEHAGEADVTDGPFLFPKLVDPTAATADVHAGAGLLDYEVELAFVILTALTEDDSPTTTGIVVCNDYTDRETLLRNVDVWNPTSGKGFTTGKSKPGFLPVGAFLVVPRDVRSFVASLELRLWVNGDLRQHARVDEWIWNLDRILLEAWARKGIAWEHAGRDVGLFAVDGTIPARTLIMAGTPAGTVFRGVGIHERASGLASWIAGGFTKPLSEHVIDAYVHAAHAERRYLQPGDRVIAQLDRVGSIGNLVVR